MSPAENAVVDRNNLVVMWHPVGSANGSPIIGYQVLVVKPNTGLRGLPKIILDVMMPPDATSMAVPPGFLLPDSAYEWEVLAIESGVMPSDIAGHFAVFNRLVSSRRQLARRPACRFPSSLTMMIRSTPPMTAGVSPSARSKPCNPGTLTRRAGAPC